MPILEVTGLTKTYATGTEALQSITLQVEAGQVFGLLGPNGAGKTTLVKILLGLRRASSGAASIRGRPVGHAGARAAVGYLPEDHSLPAYLSGRRALSIYCMLQGHPPRRFRDRCESLLERLDLRDRADDKIRHYSKGMKQRLGLAQAVLHRPELIFLDEPTDGVDPAGRQVMRELILEERARGATVFINSHLLNEVEQLCDQVAILKQGKLLQQGSLATLLQQDPQHRVRFRLTHIPAKLESLLPEGVRLLESDDQQVRFAMEADTQLDPLIDALRRAGIGIREVAPLQRTLEQHFIEVTGAQ